MKKRYIVSAFLGGLACAIVIGAVFKYRGNKPHIPPHRLSADPKAILPQPSESVSRKSGDIPVSIFSKHAIEISQMAKGTERSELLSALVAEWTQESPREAMVFCEGLDTRDPVRRKLCSDALASWLSQDAPTATQYALDRIAGDRSFAALYVAPLASWHIKNDPTGDYSSVRSLLGRLPLEEQVYVHLLPALGSTIRTNPSAASVLADLSPFSEHKEVLSAASGVIMAKRDGVEYLDKVAAGVTATSNQQSELAGAVRHLYNSNPDVAANWLLEHPGLAFLDETRMNIIAEDVWIEPARATRTALSITKDELRKEKVEETFTVWLAVDQTGARKWAAEGHVPQAWLTRALAGQTKFPAQVLR